MYLPHNHTSTSILAAKQARPIAENQGEAILKAVLSAGRKGLTTEEVCEMTGISGDSARPRLLGLEKDKKIKRSGRTRKVKSGRMALLWEPFRSFSDSSDVQ